MRRVLCTLVLLALPLAASGQTQPQQHINRIDIFTGYSYLNTHSIDLVQHGFNFSAGVNLRRWIAFGTDFSIFTGDSGVAPQDTKLVPTLQGLGLPPTLLAAKVPFDAKTFTWAIGPQINIRKWDKITLFVRPGLGLIHEKFTLKFAGTPFEPIAPIILAQVPQLKPEQSDTVPFYGAGGGIDINASKHVGFRVSADYVHSKLFDALLKGRNTLRISVGPTWKFGEMPQPTK